MSRPSFNVLREPWIPVARHDGSRVELGILPCLERAHELREIRDPAPIIEFGLYRLLVAFVLDALIVAGERPEHPLDLKVFIQAGCFRSSLLENYIEVCGDVFDLFHPSRPFLQTRMDRAISKPLAGMFPVAPSGTNVNHWHHEHEDNIMVSCQIAARLLATIAPFMTKGGRGLSPSINGAPPIYALPMGKNLFETIVLNIPLRNQDSGQGVAAWRNPRPPGEERFQATTVEALTWRPRKIQLIPEIDRNTRVYVRTMKFEQGDSTRLTWIDSNVAYQYDKDKATPIRMRENRPLWRDAGPLFLLNEVDYGRDEKKICFRRPDVIENAFAIQDADATLMIQVYGMRTKDMKVFEWARAGWFVPAKLGRSTRLGSLVYQELERAEQAAYGLRRSIKALYPREGTGNKEALRCIGERCERAYWQRLEHGFYPLMRAFDALGSDGADDPVRVAAAAKSWRQTIQNLAREQFESAASDMDADSNALERQVGARALLNNTLRKVLS